MSATTRIPFADLSRAHEDVRDELEAAFDRVVGASSFILGEEVDRFEAEFAHYCGTEHCVGVASGTAALTLILLAAGIGAGDEVIVPAHTFIASALAVVHAGATPVLCDVDQATGLIDPRATAAGITPRTAAILPVHLYGQVCEMTELRSLAGRHGLLLVEDAAQAHGATHDGQRAGSLGDAAAFSFYPSKNLGALGDAGAICTDDGELASRARQLRNLGQRLKGDHAILGYNERLDGLQAALLRAKLPQLDRWNEERRACARAYRALLEDLPEVRMLEERPETPCVFHVLPVRMDDRDAVAAGLEHEGIETGVHYSPSLAEQPVLVGLTGARAETPHAVAWAEQELSLPMFPGMVSDEAERVVETLLSVTAAGSLPPAERRVYSQRVGSTSTPD